MKLKYVVLGTLAVGLTGLIIYRYNSNQSQENQQNNRKPSAMKVEGEIIKTVPFKDNISLTGTIEADEQIELRSEVSGIVQSINFTEGATVAQGQVLVKINDIELQAQLTQAKTKEHLASENARRAQLLFQKEAISQEEYEVVSAEYLSAKAQTQYIQSQIAKTSIRAPFSGKVGLRSVSKGAYVTPTTLIAKLVKSNELKLTFSIPEKYASLVAVNTMVTFKTTGKNEEFSAKVYAIEPEIDQATRTMRVRAIFKNDTQTVLPGSFATIQLPIAEMDNAILVPTEAIVPVQDGKVVYVKKGGKAEQIPVETATRDARQVLILSGLSAGDTLITSGMLTLRAGVPVNVNVK